MLHFRLQLLKDSGQITETTCARIRDLVLFLEKRTGIVLNEDNAAMLVTHFAIALERASRGENVNPMEEMTRLQVRSSAGYASAISLLDEWLKDGSMPGIHENERDFLLLHLCVLLENLRE